MAHKLNRDWSNLEKAEHRKPQISFVLILILKVSARQELATEHSELETLERRNANLEKDVNAYMQRREIERRVELLELVLPVKEYMQAKAEYDRAKEERKKAHERVQELEAQNKPVVDFRA